MYHSRMIENATNVPFPAFTGERIYMRKIFKDKKLPDDLRRWQKSWESIQLHCVIISGQVGRTKEH